jgi:hypothetical protein
MDKTIDLTFFVVSFIGILATIISFFSVRMIKQVDESQKKLWEKFDSHETRLSRIEGEHKAFTAKGIHD